LGSRPAAVGPHGFHVQTSAARRMSFNRGGLPRRQGWRRDALRACRRPFLKRPPRLVRNRFRRTGDVHTIPLILRLRSAINIAHVTPIRNCITRSAGRWSFRSGTHQRFAITIAAYGPTTLGNSSKKPSPGFLLHNSLAVIENDRIYIAPR